MKTGTSLIHPIAKDTVAVSLFHGHSLQPKNQEPMLHFTDYDYGVTAILFFLYALYVWIYVSNRKRLNQIIKGFYINRYANQLAREEIALGNRVSLFLAILFVFALTLFAVQVNEYYGYIRTNNYSLYLLIASGIVVAYGIKLTIIGVMGHVFKMTKEAAEYRMSIFLFGNVLGLFMFPVVICLEFVKQASPLVFIYTGAGIILTFLFIRLIRGIVIGFNSQRVSKFYLFLYLCTLEILPLVIAIKLFMSFIK